MLFSNTEAAKQVIQRVDVCFASSGSCLRLKVQNTILECLWDTGAQVTLFRSDVVPRLVEQGARVEPCAPLKVYGVGNGAMQTSDFLRASIMFSDGKVRHIGGYIFPNLPHPLMIGEPFMREEHISLLWTETESILIDHKSPDKPVIYSSVDDTFQSDRARCSCVSQVSAARQEKPKTLGRKSARKFLEKLRRLPPEDLALLDKLARVRTVGLPMEKIREKLANTRFELDEVSAEPDQCCVEPSSRQANPVKKPVPLSDSQKPDDDKEFLRQVDKIVEQCDFPEVKERLRDLLVANRAIFSSHGSEVGKSTRPSVRLKLKEEGLTAFTPNYRTPIKLRVEMRRLIDELLEAGIIELSNSTDFNSPAILVEKKAEVHSGTPGHRLVVDYRALNKIIQNVVYPMPRIQDILSSYHGCKVFSNMDIRHAYYTIELNPESRHLTAFSCEYGKYQFRFLPQGLKISPAIFQNQISVDLDTLVRVAAYMDDILSGDRNPEEHLDSLAKLFARLKDRGYKLKLSKCSIMKKQVTFTGIDVTEHGIAVSESKKESARNLRKPQTLSQVKSLLGFSSFLRGHVPVYCDVIAPLQDLLLIKTGSKPFVMTDHWTSKHDLAFETLKQLLVDGKVLAFPDTSKPFILYTDASKQAMSGVLMQRDTQDRLCPIGYWSKAFKGPQLNWAALVKEARAVKEAVEHFRVFISNCEVTLMCDHRPLERFLEAKTKNEMVNRWSLDIQFVDLKFQWVESALNLSDCLSRLGAQALFEKDAGSQDVDFPSKPKPTNPSKFRTVSTNTETNPAQCCPACVMRASRRPRRDLIDETEQLPLLGVKPDDITIAKLSRLSDQQVLHLQERDGYCKRIKARLNSFDPEKNGHFMISKEGILYKAFYGSNVGAERLPAWTVVVPRVLQLSVIMNLHKELRHPGRIKMLSVLRTRMYWKGMDKQVAAFTKGCQVCIHKNLKKADYPPLRVKPPTKPFVRLALDCWKAAGRAALTGICLCTQYPFAEPLVKVDAENVCNAFSNILSQIPTPLEVVTDNGPEFANATFRHLLKSRNIRHVDIAAHSPQSNGVLEKWHRYLNKEFAFIQNHSAQDDWWATVRAVLETYRKTPHTRTMESPMFLALGHEPIYSIDHLLPTLDRVFWSKQDAASGLQQLRSAMSHARKNLALARQRSKTVIKTHEKPLQVGDRVFRMNFSRDKTKIDTKWLAGYRVLEFLTSRTVKIIHVRTGKTHIVNIRHLRWADPVSELLDNTNIDCFPGESKLYFHSKDLEDLNWEPFHDPLPLLPEHQAKLDEIVRDRADDAGPQQPPAPATSACQPSHDASPVPPGSPPHIFGSPPPGSGSTPSTTGSTAPSVPVDEPMQVDPTEQESSNKEKEEHTTERPRRMRRKPRKMRDYICGVAFRPHVLVEILNAP